jgi:hypothetical protein
VCTIAKVRVRELYCVYMSTTLIFGTNLDDILTFLCQSFDMKDLCKADVILNIKLTKGENEITLTRSHYVEKVLSHFGYKESRSSPTPYDPSLVLQKNKRISKDQLRYSQIIGSLMYLASATSLDISFVMNKLSWFTSNPGDDHWRGLKRVMQYLADTMDYGIHYSGYPSVLEGCNDAN